MVGASGSWDKPDLRPRQALENLLCSGRSGDEPL